MTMASLSLLNGGNDTLQTNLVLISSWVHMMHGTYLDIKDTTALQYLHWRGIAHSHSFSGLCMKGRLGLRLEWPFTYLDGNVV